MRVSLSGAPRLVAAAAVLALGACARPLVKGEPPAAPAPATPAAPSGAEEISAPAAPEAVFPATMPTGAEMVASGRYDIPVSANAPVETELAFLVNERHGVIGRWLANADRYDEFVRDVFASYGLPKDLHHLAMVESGYSPTARSHAGAVGMWQFMQGTGRGMGLRVDEMVDERMDPVRSTHAAARHLRDLYHAFGRDWPLALAAYNAGTGRISRGLRAAGATNFWELVEKGNLAEETKRYVPRLYAVTIIAHDPARFGYAPPSGPVRTFGYDSVQVDVVTPLAELARIAGVSYDELRALNPHLVTGTAPAGYWVWAPDGAGEAVQVAFQQSEFRRNGGSGIYIVRHGDEVGRLAELTGLTVDDIRAMNPAADPTNLRSGQRLTLPGAAARMLNQRPLERRASTRQASSSTSSESSSSRRSSRRTPSPSGERSASSERSGESSSTSERASSRSSEERSSESRSSERNASSSESRSSERSASSSSESRSSESRASERSGSGSESRSSEGRSSERSASSSRSSERSGESRSSESRSSERSGSRASSSESRSSESRSSERASETRSSERSGASSRSSERSSSERSASSSRGSSERSSSSSRTAAASRREHTVEGGETLWGIARKYDVTVEAIQEANDLGSRAIQPGDKLRIPRASSSSSSERTASSSSSSSSSERSARRSESSERSSSSSRGSSARRTRSHTVQDGETLWGIARRYDVTVDAVKTANDLGSRPIQPGQTLRIPAAESGRD